MAYLVGVKDEFISRREETQAVIGAFKKVAAVGIGRRGHCEVLNGIIEVPVQAYFLVCLCHISTSLSSRTMALSKSGHRKQTRLPRANRLNVAGNRYRVSNVSASS